MTICSKYFAGSWFAFASLLLMLLDGAMSALHSVDLSWVMEDTEPVIRAPYGNDDIENWVMHLYDPYSRRIKQADAETNWEYITNMTKENEQATLAAAPQTAKFRRLMAEQVRKFSPNRTTVRSGRFYTKLTQLGRAALSDGDLSELTQIITKMSRVFSTAEVCFEENLSYNCPENTTVPLDPDLTDYFFESRNSDKLRYLWKAWRDETGRKMRSDFVRYVELKNKAAQLNGFSDAGEAWRADYTEPTTNYTDKNVLQDLGALWKQLHPLYKEIHAYVRRKLIEQYPEEKIKPDGPIPAHLLGDMWGQTWLGTLKFTQLFPARSSLDVTDEMKRQNYTVERMFRLSETFQKDLGLRPMPESFWTKSMLKKPNDGRVVDCSPEANDMFHDDDVRLKICTEINMQDLITIHHEMGHIQYYLQYQHQLTPFRDGANQGFHEAVGDTLALSVSTPKHLAWLGLLQNGSQTIEDDLNYMFKTAIDGIAFLPFGYLVDQYRYDVFSGKIPKSRLNHAWWDYVLEYQGLAPPMERTEEDFDAGSKLHVAMDTEYMRYFISYIHEFQFHKALCKAAGHTGPLYQCDINQSKAAGKLLSKMLSVGASEPWPVTLEKMTGSKKIDASPLLEFFEPLSKYLHDMNSKNNEFVGWK